MALEEGKVKELLYNQIDDLNSKKELEGYLKTLGHFHSYSPRNVALLRAQIPEVSKLASLKTWNKLGRTVKKGEKALTIVVPKTKVKKDENNQEEEILAGFRRSSYLFDISQTKGDENAIEGIIPKSALEKLQNHISLVEGESEEGTLVKSLEKELTERGLNSFEISAATFAICSQMGVRTPLEDLVISSGSVEEARIDILFTLGQVQKAANEILDWLEV